MTPDDPSAEVPDGVLRNDHVAEHQARLRTDLVRGSLWTLLGALVSIPVSLAANFVVVRALGPSEFAKFAVLTAAFTVALVLVNAGVTTATAQELALARARGDRVRADELMRRCSGFFVFVETPALVVIVAVAVHGSGIVLMVLACLACVAALPPATALVVLSASGRNAAAARATLIMTLASQVALAVAAAVTRDADVTWVVRIASLAIAPAVAVVLLDPADRRALARPLAPWRFDRSFRITALSFWALAVAGTLLLERTEIFVLQWNGETLAVAVFALGVTVVSQLTTPMDSLMGPLAPTSAGLIAMDPSSGPRLLRSTLRVSALTGALTCAIGLPALVVLVPLIFGAAYGHVVTVLVTLGVISCLDSTLTPVRAIAFGVRSAPGVLVLTLICLAADVALALGLIPVFGLVGAVVALSTGQLLFGALLVRLVARRLGLTVLSVWSACRTALLGPVAAVAALLVSAPIGVAGVRAAVAAVVGAAVLALALRLPAQLRLSHDDLTRIRAALPDRLGQRVFAIFTRLKLVDSAADKINS